jgi:hypothetical protein
MIDTIRSGRKNFVALLFAIAMVPAVLPGQKLRADQSDRQSTTDSAAVAATSERPSKPLSVAPGDSAQFTFPENRPEWLLQSPELSGQVHRWPVVTTPASRPELAREALAAQLRAAAETYIETILDDPGAASAITIDDAWIESHLSVDHQYDGQVFRGDEVMYESAAMLLFESADRQWIEQQWQASQVGQRLVNVIVLTILAGTLLFFTTAGMSLVARRAERRVTETLET